MAQLHFGAGDSVKSGTTGSGTSATISFSKASLSNIVVGDLLVAWVHNQTSGAGTITPPSGWTAYGAASGTPTFAVTRSSGFFYYPIKTLSDITALPATITWTFTGTPAGRTGGHITRATGIDLDLIEDSASTAFQNGTGTTLTITGITTVKPTTLLVGGLHQQNSASTTSPTVTAFLTAFDEYKTSPTGSALANTGVAIGYKDLTTLGATGNVIATFDSSATATGGELVAFKAGPWPAVPTVRPTIIGTATTFVTPNPAIGFTISKPTGVQDGDLLVMALSAQTPTATTDFVSSGWGRISQPFVSSSAIYRIIAYYALPVPSAAALTATDFTFTSTDSVAGGRIAAELFIVRNADLTDITSGISPYGAAGVQGATVQPTTPLVDDDLLLVAYSAQFTAAIDYTVASGPSGMTQHIFLPSSVSAVSKTVLAVYQQDIESGAVSAKTLNWNGAQSQTSGAAVIIRALGHPDPGVAIKYTSATDVLSTAQLYYTSATDTLATPAEVRPFPDGYSSVATMLTTEPFYMAHRGGSANWPEMSLHAYTQAGFWGVGSLEVSLARTSDGVWFGLHDDTLDRTSGTSGFTASAHTWSEVQAYLITASGTTDPAQPARPYMRWEELMDAYYSTHVIFVDPKVAIAFASELLNMMDAMPGTPTSRFIAKYYGVSSGWAGLASGRGYKTWGYFYQADVPSLATYQGQWDILGMDYTANQASWTAVLSYGKPVIGHIIPNSAAATTALNFGAVGLMVSGVEQTVPRTP
jgi:hypothetical protein